MYNPNRQWMSNTQHGIAAVGKELFQEGFGVEDRDQTGEPVHCMQQGIGDRVGLGNGRRA